MRESMRSNDSRHSGLSNTTSAKSKNSKTVRFDPQVRGDGWVASAQGYGQSTPASQEGDNSEQGAADFPPEASYAWSHITDDAGRPLTTRERLGGSQQTPQEWQESPEENDYQHSWRDWHESQVGEGPVEDQTPEEPLPAYSRGAFSSHTGFKASAWDWSKFKAKYPSIFDNDNPSPASPEGQKSHGHRVYEQDFCKPSKQGYSNVRSPDNESAGRPQARSAFSSFFEDVSEDFGARMRESYDRSRSAPVSPDKDTFQEAAGNH